MSTERQQIHTRTQTRIDVPSIAETLANKQKQQHYHQTASKAFHYEPEVLAKCTNKAGIGEQRALLSHVR
ncbi:hypothetical protein HO173_002735 [Letharia columbiana]|uniref:Uncharacterized protein n=1 Tax=Letharia columbiana TaxID=112416 RepID=A0A8H6L7X5_9LECA|nr:uncharacterized protein HO173_002735 [Letharia columbiana]KAF6238863.1 hypothetical protein HO173_002735 [Letharia columbiana]